MALERDLPEPWWDLRASAPQEDEWRKALQTELNMEIGPGHVLHGRTFSVVARSRTQDDVLIALDDTSWAVVHLTWRRAREVPPWPGTTAFTSLSAAIEAKTTD